MVDSHPFHKERVTARAVPELLYPEPQAMSGIFLKEMPPYTQLNTACVLEKCSSGYRLYTARIRRGLHYGRMWPLVTRGAILFPGMRDGRCHEEDDVPDQRQNAGATLAEPLQVRA